MLERPPQTTASAALSPMPESIMRRTFFERPIPAGWICALLVVALGLATPRPAGASLMRPPYPYRAKEFTIVHDGTQFHCFYMRHNFFVVDDSTEKDLGHAVSFDLINWTQLAPVLPVRPNSWDNFHIWSPSVVKQGGLWYLFYTGVTEQPGTYHLYQRIGLATSPDLTNWTRMSAPVLSCAQMPWTYCDPSVVLGGDLRDSFVMPDPGADGNWLMYVATRPNAAHDEMLIGLAGSSSLFFWNDRKPMWNTDPAHSFSHKIESPCVFDHDGLWYLFYTTDSGHPINFETSADPTADSLAWSNQVHLSTEVPTANTDSWFGPEYFEFHGKDYFCAVSSVSLGVEIREVVWTDPPHFQFTEPMVLGVGDPGRADGVSLSLERAAPSEGRWTFAVSLPTAARAALDV